MAHLQWSSSLCFSRLFGDLQNPISSDHHTVMITSMHASIIIGSLLLLLAFVLFAGGRHLIPQLINSQSWTRTTTSATFLVHMHSTHENASRAYAFTYLRERFCNLGSDSQGEVDQLTQGVQINLITWIIVSLYIIYIIIEEIKDQARGSWHARLPYFMISGIVWLELSPACSSLKDQLLDFLPL